MKILSKNKQDEILKYLIANDYMVKQLFTHQKCDFETYDKFIKNTIEIVDLVAGVEGLIKCKNTLERLGNDS